MKQITIGLLVSGVLLSLLVVLPLAAALQKRWKRAATYLAVLLLLGSGAAGWTAYTVAHKSYQRLAKAARPRTGPEIYAGLFGLPAHPCVQVINRQDQVVPRIDYAIWLQFDTCPAELRRILTLHKFVATREATRAWGTTGPQAGNNWFKPETLGDTVLIFKYRKDDYGNGQTIFASLDSTHVYCLDVLD